MSEPRNRLDDIQESIAEQSKQIVGDHALSSALVTFGLGVGVGLTVISVLTDSGPPRRSAVTERLGAQLLDSLSAVMPDSFMKR
ncbi:hypothetical protein CA54_33750 [Symmachiella macrocystis]|uniref:Uncharacterized protein n=1 Tax=Symmachiella macrocystis TaxID=2527985 RepID=A0A5C6BR33_9PLAN|nr:hypothetical protein [Symmachiella macrocystis]TWU14508.1 hypothetical protein CA54_33750 [Symmachiella macrocystis]